MRLHIPDGVIVVGTALAIIMILQAPTYRVSAGSGRGIPPQTARPVGQCVGVDETAITETPTSTASPVRTPTPTTTGNPGLISPPDGAVLPQPVAPNVWHFAWRGRTYQGCSARINIYGPQGRHIAVDRYWPDNAFFDYQTNVYLPDDALGPWYWSVTTYCLGLTNHSGVSTFSVEPAPDWTPTPALTATKTRAPATATRTPDPTTTSTGTCTPTPSAAPSPTTEPTLTATLTPMPAPTPSATPTLSVEPMFPPDAWQAYLPLVLGWVLP